VNKHWWYPTAFSCWGDEEREAIARVVQSGRFTMGDEVAAFEEEFAAYHKMKYAVMTNSGSSANLLMVAALFSKFDQPLRKGDYALVPALAWSTTYAPLVQHGLGLKLVDCDDGWVMEKPDVGSARLVVACSILGNPAPLDFLRTAAEACGAYMIEDNCESLGAWHGNERCGTFGLMNSFSFFYSHQVSAVEGGMVLTNDPECNKLCRVLRAHGWMRDVQSSVGFDDEYNFTRFGYNVRPVEMHAAVARCQLKKLNQFVWERWRNLKLFEDSVKGLPITLPVWRGEPSPFGIQFTVSSSEVRRQLAGRLRAGGVDCRLPTGGSFSRHPYGRAWRYQETPRADCIHECGMFIGNGPLDLSDRIESAVKIMKEVL
jgi:CDP-4-dehydro-6-deoxyglucose reductase, E1